MSNLSLACLMVFACTSLKLFVKKFSTGQVTGGGKMKKDAPRNAHNIKERQRRQDISQAADNLRKIVPTLSTADKVTFLCSTTTLFVKMID